MTTPETYSVTQTGKIVGRSPNWVRLRTKDPKLIPHLSEYATPPEGQERRFTEEDITILHSVITLLDRGKRYSEIYPLIAKGDRYEPVKGEDIEETAEEPLRAVLEPLKAPRKNKRGEGYYLAKAEERADLMVQFEILVKPYESQISSLEAQIKGEREDLKGQIREEREALEREREARITAETERSKLEGKLEEIERARVPWYRKLFGGGGSS